MRVLVQVSRECCVVLMTIAHRMSENLPQTEDAFGMVPVVSRQIYIFRL